MTNRELLQEQIEIILNKKNLDFSNEEIMGGLCYMIDEKMCFGIVGDDFMVNVGEKESYHLNDLEGVRLSSQINQPIKGCLYIAPEGLEYASDLKYWIEKSLKLNCINLKKKKD